MQSYVPAKVALSVVQRWRYPAGRENCGSKRLLSSVLRLFLELRKSVCFDHTVTTNAARKHADTRPKLHPTPSSQLANLDQRGHL